MNDLLTYKNYFAIIHFSAEDKVFYGKIQGITDLVTFEGKSVNELKKTFKEAIEDYIRTCKELGKPVEKSYKGSFNIRISSNLHKEAAMVASKENISLNDFVRAAIGYAVKHIDKIGQEIR